MRGTPGGKELHTMDTQAFSATQAQVRAFFAVLHRGDPAAHALNLRLLGEHPGIPRNTKGTVKTKTVEDHDALTLPDTLERAWKMNAEGWAVYTPVNRLDSQEGQPWSKRRFPAGRAVVAEFDSKNGQQPPTTWPLQPTMVVQSKGGPHAWWVLDSDQPVEGVEGLSRAVAQALGSDPTVWDRTRILRVPGFWHWKDPASPFWVHLDASQSSGRLVTFDQVRAAYGGAALSSVRAPVDVPVEEVEVIEPPPTPDELSWAYQEAVRRLQEIGPAVQGQHGDDKLFRKVAPMLHDLGLPWTHAAPLLAWWNSVCLPPWPAEELQDKWARALTNREEPVGRDLELRRFSTAVTDSLRSSRAAAPPPATPPEGPGNPLPPLR